MPSKGRAEIRGGYPHLDIEMSMFLNIKGCLTHTHTHSYPPNIHLQQQLIQVLRWRRRQPRGSSSNSSSSRVAQEIYQATLVCFLFSKLHCLTPLCPSASCHPSLSRTLYSYLSPFVFISPCRAVVVFFPFFSTPPPPAHIF